MMLLKDFLLVCLLAVGIITKAAAQDRPTTSEINIEAITEVLDLSEEPQLLQIDINCSTPGPVDFIALDLPGITAVMSLVSASLNDEPLWLIQSQSKAASLPNIISWNFEKDRSRLILYPGDWTAGYKLNLDIQISLDRINELLPSQKTAVKMEVGLPTGIFNGGQSGRGNQLIVQ